MNARERELVRREGWKKSENIIMCEGKRKLHTHSIPCGMFPGGKNVAD